MEFVECETGSFSETCDADGSEEFSFKVAEAIYIKDEIPEATSLPPIKTELEVRLLGWVWAGCSSYAVRPFIAPKRKL